MSKISNCLHLKPNNKLSSILLIFIIHSNILILNMIEQKCLKYHKKYSHALKALFPLFSCRSECSSAQVLLVTSSRRVKLGRLVFHVLKAADQISKNCLLFSGSASRCHPVICSVDERKLDAPQLTRFSVYFHVQCGIKM